MSSPPVSIIIPHFNGETILTDCLTSLSMTEYSPFEIILVDNGSTDQSVNLVKKKFPAVRVIQNKSNLGYAGGCNAGLQASTAKYAVLLNNDTVQEPDWLRNLVDEAEKTTTAGAWMPKLLYIKDHQIFDYSGAAGGLIDIFGYPFAYGRLFFTVETDSGQYDHQQKIFWASGTCCMLRRDLIEKTGPLDESFFAHMEEIDLNWRLHLLGYDSIVVPRSIVYHYSGGTLSAGSYKKHYLNHRNNLMMLLKNYSAVTLCWILPPRLMFELATLVFSLVKLDWNRTKALFSAWSWLIRNWGLIQTNRKKVQQIRQVSDRQIFQSMFRGSIVWQHYVLRKKFVSKFLN